MHWGQQNIAYGGEYMKRKINISSPEEMARFVNAASKNGSEVMVSKDGFNLLIDGASLMGMMTLLASNIIVHSHTITRELEHIINMNIIK